MIPMSNQNSGSRSASTASNTAHLARVRENQRRSRARRKEYLSELEDKFRKCRDKGVEASAEMQLAARRVLEENARLRMALRAKGMSDEEIDDLALSSAQNGPVADLGNLLQNAKPCLSDLDDHSNSTVLSTPRDGPTFSRSIHSEPSAASSEGISEAFPSSILPSSSSLAPSGRTEGHLDQYTRPAHQLPASKSPRHDPTQPLMTNFAYQASEFLNSEDENFFAPGMLVEPVGTVSEDGMASAGYSTNPANVYMSHLPTSPAISRVDTAGLLSPELQAHFSEALSSGGPRLSPDLDAKHHSDPEWMCQ